jgi:hypothetical protein
MVEIAEGDVREVQVREQAEQLVSHAIADVGVVPRTEVGDVLVHGAQFTEGSVYETVGDFGFGQHFTGLAHYRYLFSFGGWLGSAPSGYRSPLSRMRRAT